MSSHFFKLDAQRMCSTAFSILKARKTGRPIKPEGHQEAFKEEVKDRLT